MVPRGSLGAAEGQREVKEAGDLQLEVVGLPSKATGRKGNMLF